MNRFLRQIFYLNKSRTCVRFFNTWLGTLDIIPDYGYAPRPRRVGDPRDAIAVREKKPVWMLHESSD
jgi:hypothetical protein